MNRNEIDEIRRKAEALLQEKITLDDLLVEQDLPSLLHELRVHQIELALQNEDLRQAQQELEITRDKYADLYNFAPVGYFTIGADGLIMDVNLTGSTMLGIDRNNLIKRPFSRFVKPAEEANYYWYRRRLFEMPMPQSYELKLLKADGNYFQAHLEGMPVQDETGQIIQARLAISDISLRHQAEEELKQYRNQLERLVRERTAKLEAEIIERQRIAETLRDQERFVQAVVNTTPAILYIYSVAENRNIWANKLHQEFLGRADSAKLDRQQLIKIVHPDDRPNLSHRLAQLKQSPDGEWLEVEYRLQTPEDRWHWFHDRSSVFARDDQEKVVEIIGAAIDITERKKFESQLWHDSTHDNLTNLPNRTFFIDHLEQAIQQSQQNPAYQSVVMFIDLDHFKIINDSLGHLMGDQLLVKVAHRLTTCIRSDQDLIARFGGDEFVVLLTNIEHINEVVEVANHIQHRLAKPFTLSHNGQESQITITTSIGIVSSQGYDQSVDMLRDADNAMYQAKNRGRNRYQLFEIGMYDQALSNLQLTTSLRQAIKHQDFELYYQPVVALDNHQIVGAEALLRWQGQLNPTEVINLAEETGLIVSLGDWVMQTACRQLKNWHTNGYPSLCMAVNISARQFETEHIFHTIKQSLRDNHLSAQHLQLEILEQTTLPELEVMIPILSDLKELGIKISVDDFGVGSSLALLNHLPVDILKIDQSFIKNMTTDKDKALIKAIIAMAQAFDLQVVAEGVEKLDHLTFLQFQQCDLVQGYLISPPMPADQFTELLRDHSSFSWAVAA